MFISGEALWLPAAASHLSGGGQVRCKHTCPSALGSPAPHLAVLSPLGPGMEVRGRLARPLRRHPQGSQAGQAGPGRAQGQALCSETPQEKEVGGHLGGVSVSKRP